MRVAERQRRPRPQLTPLDPTACTGRWLLDGRRVRQPTGQIGLAAAIPPLKVQLAQAGPGDAVAARVDPADRVGALPTPPCVGRRGEHVEIASALVNPPLM